MSQLLKIDLDYLRNFQKINFVLENCDVYAIDISDVLDISFEATPVKKDGESKSKSFYRTDGGFIRLSPKAGTELECITKRELQKGVPEFDLFTSSDPFLERMQLCCDICYITLEGDRTETYVYTPYDPLTDVIFANELDYSNCPSFEVDDSGNLLFFFGHLSKQPRRVDNNYHELIEGWSEVMGDYRPDLLRGEIYGFDYSSYDNSSSVFFTLEVKRKGKSNTVLELSFSDVKNVHLEHWGKLCLSCDVYMSKLPNGDIYVGLTDYAMNFYCKKITARY